MGSFIASLFTTALAVQGAIAALTTTTATLGTQHCHSPDQFGNYADVNDRVQKFGASMTCHKKGGLISSGDSPITFYVTGANDKPGYHYGISWVDGCEGDSQNSLTPVEGTTCEDILIGNWKNCKWADTLSACRNADDHLQAITTAPADGLTQDV